MHKRDKSGKPMRGCFNDLKILTPIGQHKVNVSSANKIYQRYLERFKKKAEIRKSMADQYQAAAAAGLMHKYADVVVCFTELFAPTFERLIKTVRMNDPDSRE